jgi:hypothetical protein
MAIATMMYGLLMVQSKWHCLVGCFGGQMHFLYTKVMQQEWSMKMWSDAELEVYWKLFGGLETA